MGWTVLYIPKKLNTSFISCCQYHSNIKLILVVEKANMETLQDKKVKFWMRKKNVIQSSWTSSSEKKEQTMIYYTRKKGTVTRNKTDVRIASYLLFGRFVWPAPSVSWPARRRPWLGERKGSMRSGQTNRQILRHTDTRVSQSAYENYR